MEKKIVVYEPRADVRLEAKTDGDAVWLTQDQMCGLFGRERSVITKHIRNIFKEGELAEEVACAKFAHAEFGVEGERGGRPVTCYNPDVIITVGYRVKSVQETRYLVHQLAAPLKPPKRRRIGFGVDTNTPSKPYGKIQKERR